MRLEHSGRAVRPSPPVSYAIKADGKEQTESVSSTPARGNQNPSSIDSSLWTVRRTRTTTRLPGWCRPKSTRPRILYIEGEPKWEFKFIRRAIEPDQSLQLTTILRTTQNKIYRQGIDTPAELEQGFPATVDELFKYQGIIIGGVEANYFTPDPAGTPQTVRRSTRRRIALARRTLGIGGWRLGALRFGRSASGEPAGSEGYLPSRSGKCGAYCSRSRQSDLPARRMILPATSIAGRSFPICRITRKPGRQSQARLS